MTKAINRREETDAKLENLSMDVHKIHGDVGFLREELKGMKDELTLRIKKLRKTNRLYLSYDKYMRNST